MVNSLFDAKWKGGYRIVTHKSQPARTTALHDKAKDSVWQHTEKVMARIIGSDNGDNASSTATTSGADDAKKSKSKKQKKTSDDE
jgi:hypothetical protein